MEELNIKFSINGKTFDLFNCISKEDLEKYAGAGIKEKAIAFLIDDLEIESIYNDDGETLWEIKY